MQHIIRIYTRRGCTYKDDYIVCTRKCLGAIDIHHCSVPLLNQPDMIFLHESKVLAWSSGLPSSGFTSAISSTANLPATDIHRLMTVSCRQSHNHRNKKSFFCSKKFRSILALLEKMALAWSDLLGWSSILRNPYMYFEMLTRLLDLKQSRHCSERTNRGRV